VAQYTAGTARQGGAGLCDEDGLFFYARQVLNLEMLLGRVSGAEGEGNKCAELHSAASVTVSPRAGFIDGRCVQRRGISSGVAAFSSYRFSGGTTCCTHCNTAVIFMTGWGDVSTSLSNSALACRQLTRPCLM